MGYRFYEATLKATQFPFGHGLSYTTFRLSELAITNDGTNLTVQLLVENTGDRDGSEVVQVYVAQRAPCVKRPLKELKGFTKENIAAGQSKVVTISIETKYATSYWDGERDTWVSEKDTYDVLVGTTSAETPLKASFEVEESKWWLGL